MSSQKSIVIIGRESVRFDASLLIMKAPQGEVIIAKKYSPETETICSSFTMCSRYDFWTERYIHIEEWKCDSFPQICDSLEVV